MNNGFKHTQEAIKQRGEVFTPTKLVKQMLGKLPRELFKDRTKTFLDSSCGNGQFLFEVMKAKMLWMKLENNIRCFDAHKTSLKTIYGCELDPVNAENCRLRLLNGSTSKELRAIVNHNIITADALDPNHDGWKDVGFYWSNDDSI